MSLKNFIFSKIFLKNIGFALTIFAALLLLLVIWMNLYTRHGQARPVPDFTGLSLNQADRLAKKNKLRFQIIDSVYTSAVAKGSVAEQNPKPGFRVKKWRNVMLTINAFRPEMVAMPNLVDLPLRQAVKVIESAGLQQGQLRFKPDISQNVVLEQLHRGKPVSEGDSVQKGSTIDLVLGKGLSNQRTHVPYLLGMNLNPAKNRISESSLNLGTFIYDNTIRDGRDSLKSFVYKQNPEYSVDATLPLGSDIYLWLTVDSSKLAVDSTTVRKDTIPALQVQAGTPK